MKSDGKGHEPYDFTQMWDIKQCNKPNKLIDTNKSTVASRAEGGGGRRGKGSQLHGDRRRLDFRW